MEAKEARKKFRIWLEDGILRLTWAPKTRVALEDAQEALEAIANLSQDDARPVLVDIRNVRSIDREARDCYSKSTARRAVALLVASPVTKVIANFFLGLNRAVVPVKVFNHESAAIHWLTSFLS